MQTLTKLWFLIFFHTVKPHDAESVSSVSKLVPNNYFTEEETRAIPNGTAKKNRKSKVISHEAEGNHVPQTVILRGKQNGYPGGARRVSAFQDLYPPEPAMSPVMINGKKGAYDVSSGRLLSRSGSVLSSASIALPQSRTRSRSPSVAPSVRSSSRGRRMTAEETLRKFNQKDREMENAAFSHLADGGFDDSKSRSSKRKHRSKDEKKHRHKHHKDREGREHKHSKDHKVSTRSCHLHTM